MAKVINYRPKPGRMERLPAYREQISRALRDTTAKRFTSIGPSVAVQALRPQTEADN